MINKSIKIKQDQIQYRREDFNVKNQTGNTMGDADRYKSITREGLTSDISVRDQPKTDSSSYNSQN